MSKLAPSLVGGIGLLAILLCCCGCSKKRETTIIIDGWWDDDYAANVCQAAEANKQSGLISTGCIELPSMMIASVESGFLSAFQANLVCENVSIYKGFRNPETASPEAAKKLEDADWDLSFNINVKEGLLDLETSVWQIIDSKTKKRFAEGNLKNYKEATTDVCRMVRGLGGKITP